MSKLISTGNSGFQLWFKNKWAVSVQFGPYNYCERRTWRFKTGGPDDPEKERVWSSPDAEIAVFLPNGKFLQTSDCEEYGMDWMLMHVSPEETAKITAAISSLNEDSSEQEARDLINEIIQTEESSNI